MRRFGVVFDSLIVLLWVWIMFVVMFSFKLMLFFLLLLWWLVWKSCIGVCSCLLLIFLFLLVIWNLNFLLEWLIISNILLLLNLRVLLIMLNKVCLNSDLDIVILWLLLLLIIFSWLLLIWFLRLVKKVVRFIWVKFSVNVLCLICVVWSRFLM